MNARQLEIFRAVMRTGSATEAARLLNVSQPTISKVLRHAESQLGLRLFRNVRGRLAPTPEAEILFPNADRVFRDLNALKQLVHDLRAGEGGTVRVAASSSLATTVLARAIRSFRATYSRVHVILHLSPALETAEAVRAHQADIGLTLSPVVTATLDVKKIGHSGLIVLVPEASPLTRKSALAPADLVEETLISFGSDSHFGVLLDEVFEKAGLKRRIDVQVFSSVAAAALVAQGDGVAVVDRLMRYGLPPGVSWRPFKPEIHVPVNLIVSDTQPYSCFCAAMIDEIGQAVQEMLVEAESEGS